jgi:hypothetical protein
MNHRMSSEERSAQTLQACTERVLHDRNFTTFHMDIYLLLVYLTTLAQPETMWLRMVG